MSGADESAAGRPKAQPWTEDELSQVQREREVHVVTQSSSGQDRRPVVIWAVRVDDEVYIRSAGGPSRPWYRAALRHPSGALVVDGERYAVTFEPAAEDRLDAVDDAYRSEYGVTYAGIVASITAPGPRSATLRVNRVGTVTPGLR